MIYLHNIIYALITQYICLLIFQKHLTEGAKLTQYLLNQVQSLERSKKNYEKAFKESEKALDNFHKADADLNLSRAEVRSIRITIIATL